MCHQVQVGRGAVVESCEHGKEPLGSIKGQKFLD
jgi:hypothetical protein